LLPFGSPRMWSAMGKTGGHQSTKNSKPYPLFSMIVSH